MKYWLQLSVRSTEGHECDAPLFYAALASIRAQSEVRPHDEVPENRAEVKGHGPWAHLDPEHILGCLAITAIERMRQLNSPLSRDISRALTGVLSLLEEIRMSRAQR